MLPEHESTLQLAAPEAVQTAFVEQPVPEMAVAGAPEQLAV
jgi:hypothetical protein